MLAAFTYRDFRVQWIGACTSSIGTWMQIVAQNWLGVSLAAFRMWGYSEPQAMNACFFLNSLSFLVVINTLMMLRVKHIPPATSGRMQEELKSGLNYVRHHASLAALIVLAAATTFLGFALLTFLPIFAKQIFHEGADTFAHLMAFSGAGSIV